MTKNACFIFPKTLYLLHTLDASTDMDPVTANTQSAKKT
uniref:Uncharacterized protein n=1 Tax=Tetranychus urticae TaxID=32264 RepID=T1KR24_TETUR